MVRGNKPARIYNSSRKPSARQPRTELISLMRTYTYTRCCCNPHFLCGVFGAQLAIKSCKREPVVIKRITNGETSASVLIKSRNLLAYVSIDGCPSIIISDWISKRPVSFEWTNKYSNHFKADCMRFVKQIEFLFTCDRVWEKFFFNEKSISFKDPSKPM